MLHYRTGSRFISYIDMEGTKLPCTYFPNLNLADAMGMAGFAASCYRETFRLFYCDIDPLKGCFVFFFYNPAFNGDFPVGCLAASPADAANFLHEFYSDYHAPMTQQIDIPRMADPDYKAHAYSAAEQMITSIMGLELEEVTAEKGMIDARKVPAPLMEYLNSLHPFYVTFQKKAEDKKIRLFKRHASDAAYNGRYIKVLAHTKAAVEEYLLENGLYDDADCIMDETLYNDIRKKMKPEALTALNHPDIINTPPAAEITHDRPVFHVDESDKSIIFDYYAIDEKVSCLQRMLGLPKEERKEALLKAVGQRERLF